MGRFFSLLLALGLVSSNHAGEFSISFYGTIGSYDSIPHSINNSGQAAGKVYNYGSLYHAMYFDGTTMNDITPAGEDWSSAIHISDGGLILGARGSSGNYDPYVYDTTNPSSPWTQLAQLEEDSTAGVAESMNANGIIVGYTDFSEGGHNKNRAVTWNIASPQTPNELLRLSGHNYSRALGINDDNIVVGWSGNSMGSDRTACIWDHDSGSISSLPGLVGSTDNVPTEINSSGDIVGHGRIGAEYRACLWLWDETSGEYDAMEIGEGRGAYANDINDQGIIVGSVGEGWTTETMAFIWDEENGFRDLNGLVDNIPVGWTLLSADGINDLGHIVGSMGNDAGDRQMFVAIPEPASIGLLGLVGGGIYFTRRFFIT